MQLLHFSVDADLKMSVCALLLFLPRKLICFFNARITCIFSWHLSKQVCLQYHDVVGSTHACYITFYNEWLIIKPGIISILSLTSVMSVLHMFVIWCSRGSVVKVLEFHPANVGSSPAVTHLRKGIHSNFCCAPQKPQFTRRHVIIVYAYSTPPDPVAGGEGDWLPLSNNHCSRHFGPHLSCSPTPELCPHLMQAGDAPESHIGYDLNLCFPVSK